MRAACAQLEAKSMANSADVWPVVDRLADQAAERGDDLLVFPEVCYPSYWLESPERYDRRDILRTTDVIARFSDLARQKRLWIVAGIVEESGGRLFNSAVVLNRAGKTVGIARKQFLWDCDHRWFTPGEGSSVFKTELGQMGVLICADLRVPEISATLVARGAEMIVQPTAWVNIAPAPDDFYNIQPDFLVQCRAIEFSVPLICCSKSGRETTGMGYVGQSRIVDAQGRLLTAAGPGGDALVFADIEPAPAVHEPIDPALARRLLQQQPRAQTEPSTGPCEIHLNAGSEGIAAQLSSQSVRVLRVGTADLRSFAVLRCAALDGVQVAIVDGAATESCFARTRAAENRIFVIVTRDQGAEQVIDVTGTVIWRRHDSTSTIELDIGQADRKQFTPTTEIFDQRRPASYAFGC